MSDASSQDKNLLATLLGRARPAWGRLRSRLFRLDERTRLNLLLGTFNLMLLAVVAFALLYKEVEVRYETVVQTVIVAQTAAVEEPTRAVETAIAGITATASAQPTATPTATFTPPSPMPTPTPTFTSFPPTDTPTSPPPTETFTPSPTPPTPTPTSTYTPTPTNTPVTPEPTTPSPTSPTPTDTYTPSPTPPRPVVSSIAPNSMVQSSGPPLPVTITGQHFVAGLTAWLGEDIPINVVTNTATTIDGRLSRDIPVGVYGLTVQNPDGKTGYLSPAFTVRPPPGAEEVTFTTYGSSASPGEGDDDHVQIIFVEVPDGPDDDLYLRIFDADTGGGGEGESTDLSGADGRFGDTEMTYTVRGRGGAYTNAAARAHHPGPAGITSGEVLTQVVIGADGALDDAWLALPITRADGERVGNSRVFKLVVQGTNGDDGNWYQVAVSSAPGENQTVADSRIFAFSWCLTLRSPGEDAAALYPHVGQGTRTVTQFNFDFDFLPGDGSAITLRTPLRNLAVGDGGMSRDSSRASQSFPTLDGETGTTWSARYQSGAHLSTNAVTLWFTGDGSTLPIFTLPMTEPAP